MRKTNLSARGQTSLEAVVIAVASLTFFTFLFSTTYLIWAIQLTQYHANEFLVCLVTHQQKDLCQIELNSRLKKTLIFGHYQTPRTQISSSGASIEFLYLLNVLNFVQIKHQFKDNISLPLRY